MATQTEMETLLEMLRSGQKMDQQVNWDVVREEWLKAIDQLYLQVDEWLATTKDEGLAISRVPIERTEENLGEYKTEELRISAGNLGVLRLIPNARLVIGAQGRVDAIAGVSKILLLRKRPDEWVIVWRRGTEKNEEPLNQESCAKLITTMLS